MTNNHSNFWFSKVFHAKFNSNWCTTYFPMCKFKARIVLRSIINCSTDSSTLELSCKFKDFILKNFRIIIFIVNWNQNNLGLRYSWRQNESSVVRMNHDHWSNWSCREAPWSLLNKLFLFIFVGIPDIKHFWEILAKMMRSCSLNTSSTYRDVQLYSCRVFSTCKSFIFWFASLNHRDSK